MGDPLVGLLRPGHDQAEATGPDHLAVAADGRGQEGHTALGARLAHRRRRLGRHRRAVDDDPGHLVPGEQPALTDEHLLEVGLGGHHREDHVETAQVGDRVGDRAPDLGQRLGLGPGAVPDGDVLAGLGQTARHRGAHPARADPADAEGAGCGVVHVQPAFVVGEAGAASRAASQSAVRGRCQGATLAQPWLPSSSISSSTGPGDGVAEPDGVLPRDQPVQAAEDDEQRGDQVTGRRTPGRGSGRPSARPRHWSSPSGPGRCPG